MQKFYDVLMISNNFYALTYFLEDVFSFLYIIQIHHIKSLAKWPSIMQI